MLSAVAQPRALVLVLLPSALAYVAQLPASIAQTAQNATQSPGNGTLATPSIDTASLALSQELPPDPFRVEYFWDPNRKTFDRFAYYSQMLENLVSLVNAEWNSTLQTIRFPVAFGIQMQFVSDRTGVGMKVKHVIWALEEIFDIFAENNLYATGTVIVNSNWWDDRLAIGSVKVVARPTSDVNQTTPSLIPSAETSDYDQLNTSDIMPLVNGNQTSPPTISLTARTSVNFQLDFPQGGASFTDYQVYNATLKMMIKNAEVDRKDLPVWPILSTYNDMDNFTMSIRPISFQKRSLLSYRVAQFVLCYWPMDMLRYSEMSGIATVGGKPAAVLCLDKGDRTTWNTADLCQPPRLSEIVSEADGVSTS